MTIVVSRQNLVRLFFSLNNIEEKEIKTKSPLHKLQSVDSIYRIITGEIAQLLMNAEFNINRSNYQRTDDTVEWKRTEIKQIPKIFH